MAYNYENEKVNQEGWNLRDKVNYFFTHSWDSIENTGKIPRSAIFNRDKNRLNTVIVLKYVRLVTYSMFNKIEC